MTDEQLKNLYDLAYTQVFSLWTNIRESMLQAHEEIIRLRNRIKELEKLFYPMVRDFPQKAEKLLEQIKKLRALQQFLLQAYAWEKQGVLTDEDIPEELEEFL